MPPQEQGSMHCGFSGHQVTSKGFLILGPLEPPLSNDQDRMMISYSLFTSCIRAMK